MLTTKLSTLPFCSYFHTCSGCEIQKDFLNPPLLKEIKRDFPELSFFTDKITGWRTRAKLAVRGITNHPQIGLFKRGTHEVIPIPDCPMHHPHINRAVEHVRQWMIEEKVSPYQEHSHTGVLRYIQCVVQRKTGKVQLTLVINIPQLSESLLASLKQKEDWHSIWINVQTERTNRIFGEGWQLIDGEPFLWEELASTSICFHPACFAQAHLDLFEKILLSIREKVKPGQRIVEFYAGVGAIGLSLASQAASLSCSEINPFAQPCFEFAQQPFKISSRFITSPSREALFLLEGADVIVVDPPRKGLEPELLQAILNNSSAHQLVYLSCGYRSFKQDREKFLTAGWKMVCIEGYLLFPGTDHVETLAFFERI